MHITIVTGLSGAGKSLALNTFEDIGFEVIDNMPLSLLPNLINRSEHPDHNVAVGIDARTRDFSTQAVEQAINEVTGTGEHTVEILFLDCDNEVLGRRFQETRRKHPLALDRPVEDGVAHERSLLKPLKENAHIVIDTSELLPADLKRMISDQFAKEEQELAIFVTSFSVRKGVPREADLVFDVRFLRNPHYDPTLRPMSGEDEVVGNYIEEDKDFSTFFNNVTQLIGPLMPRYMQEGKYYLTVAIGCTGGRHRSVYVAQKLAGFLKKLGYKVELRHRDLK